MNISKIKEMSDDHVSCDFAEVKMYTLIHIAESLERLYETLQILNFSVQD